MIQTNNFHFKNRSSKPERKTRDSGIHEKRPHPNAVMSYGSEACIYNIHIRKRIEAFGGAQKNVVVLLDYTQYTRGHMPNEFCKQNSEESILKMRLTFHRHLNRTSPAIMLGEAAESMGDTNEEGQRKNFPE